MNELALFAGAGGGILGTHLLGWNCVCAVEIEDYPRQVLLARQRDGILPHFPIWDDVKTFDGHPWRGRVDVVSAGFPCQGISTAGKGEGLSDSRSGLWTEVPRIVGEVQPRLVLVENSPMLTVRGIGIILGDLAALGYDARWGVLGAHHSGAPHKRDRIWILAHPPRSGQEQGTGRRRVRQAGATVADTNSERGRRRNARRKDAVDANTSREIRLHDSPGIQKKWWDIDPANIPDANSEGREERARETGSAIPRTDPDDRERAFDRPIESRVGRVAHGVAHRMDRLKAIGNGQAPAVVELALNTLGEDDEMLSL